MGNIMLRVKSPNEEIRDAYDAVVSEEDTNLVNFLSDRLINTRMLLDEVSHELAVVRLNYEEVLRRLNKYEPTEELPEREYMRTEVPLL